MNNTAIIALSLLAVGGVVAAVMLAKKPPVLATTTVTNTQETKHEGVLGFLKGIHLSIA